MVTKWADGELALRRCREACAASKMTPDVPFYGLEIVLIYFLAPHFPIE
jgi:hypothetical protein